MAKKTKDRLFLASWDQLGLEALVDLTEKQEEVVASEKLAAWNALKNEECKPQNFDTWAGEMLYVMKLRARLNYHRHYEIYTFKADYSMNVENFRAMFEASPQTIADLIRAKGNCLLDMRAEPNSIKIQ